MSELMPCYKASYPRCVLHHR